MSAARAGQASSTLARPRSARRIAIAAKDAGLHGVMYPSYFGPLRSDRIPNIALFGHPVDSGLVKVDCINRLTLDTARYTVQLGPCLPQDSPHE
jgi:hypothetical protein